jgi:hypothetical protein
MIAVAIGDRIFVDQCLERETIFTMNSENNVSLTFPWTFDCFNRFGIIAVAIGD